jgi:hypothetical protein
MIDDGNHIQSKSYVPAELQQVLPRKFRPQLAVGSIYYFVGTMVVSGAIATFAMLGGSQTLKEIKDRNALKQESSLTYTNDVRVGGLHSATVYYSFVSKGRQYRGEAFLPREYSERVRSYSRTGNFPVLFVPTNPSINHPYDWTGSGSPLLFFILSLIVIVQWVLLARFMLYDLRLARNGVVALAQVTRCYYGRNGGIRLKYEFRDSEGLLIEGRGEYPLVRKPGSEVCVLYLLDQPEKSRPYPLVFFRVVA